MMETRPTRTAALSRLSHWLAAPVDAAGLAAFRVLFGALMVLAVVRFAAYGWIHELYIAPGFHFTYDGFAWVTAWPGRWMYVHFAVVGLSAVALMLGWYTRVAAVTFLVSFTYAELIEKAIYLNHYYFVSLMAGILAVVPAGAMWSLDARRRGPRSVVPRWAYVLAAGQLGVVYFFAGLAKVDSDWLLRAEPLRTWMQAYADVPVIGPALASTAVAYAMSWFGAIYDLTIVLWLGWAKTRRVAYLAVLAFHGAIWLLFPIGVFSLVMVTATTLFFAPEWPRRVLTWGRRWRLSTPRRPSSERECVPGLRAAPAALSRWGVAALAGYFAVQLAVPLRHAAIPGYVNWTEDGFRFAWRVMLVEKTGQVEFRVQSDVGVRVIYPRRELTPLQHKMMSTAPDMIHEYALHLADRFRRAGHHDVRVYADAWAALNGRPSQRLIDPTVDLAAVPRERGVAELVVALEG